jgi:transposase, IS5 family
VTRGCIRPRKVTNGMKAHIGVDARGGLTHSQVTTAANVHDLNQLGDLLHGGETLPRRTPLMFTSIV